MVLSRMVWRLLALLAALLPSTSSVTPARPLGFAYGGRLCNPKVRLEVFLGPLCSDSKEAYPRTLEVAGAYRDRGVEVVFYLIPLPYHEGAWDKLKGAYMTHLATKGKGTLDFIKDVYDGLGETDDSGTVDISGSLEGVARKMYKYGSEVGVTFVPSFRVNGFLQPDIKQSWTFEEWQQFLDPLLEEQVLDETDGYSVYI